MVSFLGYPVITFTEIASGSSVSMKVLQRQGTRTKSSFLAFGQVLDEQRASLREFEFLRHEWTWNNESHMLLNRFLCFREMEAGLQ